MTVMLTTSFGNIRPWTAGDADVLVKYGNNRNVSRNLTDAFPFPYTMASAQAFLGLVAAQDPTTFFAIATAEEAIGGIGVMLRADVHRLTAEIGYWLAEPFWGRGIITEALTRFTDFAFERFRLVRIYAEPYATNTASCRVLEKSGYQLEGRLRKSVIKDGQILYQLLYAGVR